MRHVLEAFEEFASISVESKSASPEQVKKCLLKLTASCRDVNDNDHNKGIFPWIFVSVENDDALSETVVDLIMTDVAKKRAASEFRVVEHGQYKILCFSHAGRPIAEGLCKEYGIGYVNLLGNGLITDSIAIINPWFASEEQLVADLSAVRKRLC